MPVELEVPVLIVGAGPVGLALALELGLRENDSLVIEQAAGRFTLGRSSYRHAEPLQGPGGLEHGCRVPPKSRGEHRPGHYLGWALGHSSGSPPAAAGRLGRLRWRRQCLDCQLDLAGVGPETDHQVWEGRRLWLQVRP